MRGAASGRGHLGRCAAASLIAALIAAAPAWAGGEADGEPARLAVYVYGADGLSEVDRVLIRARTAAGAAAAAHYEVTELGAAEAAGADAEAALERGDGALREAHDAVRQLELEQAVSLLDRAVGEYVQHLPLLVIRDATPHRLVDAYVQSAVVHYLNGEEELADSALRRALVLDPGLDTARGRIPPQLHDFVQTRQFLIEELGRGGLDIRVEGDQAATVYVNGIDRGPAPARVDDLVAGANVVHVQAPGAEPLMLEGPVEGRGSVTELRARLSPAASADLEALEATRPAAGRDTADAAMGAAGGEAGAEALLLVVPSVRGDDLGLRAYLYDLRSGRLVATGEETAESAELADAAARLGRTAVSSAAWAPPADPLVERRPLWRRVREHDYFWPAVGVAAGVLVVGLVVAADSGLSNGKKVTLFPVVDF